MRRRLNTILTALVGACAVAVANASPAGVANAAEHGNTMLVRITSGGDGPVSEKLLLPRNKAAIIELPADAADVVVSDPEIVDAVIRTPRRIFVLGREIGQANAFFFDSDGDQILNLEIQVERDVMAVQDMIDKVIPGSRVVVEALNDSLVLTGVVTSAVEADRALQVARRFVEEPEQVLNLVAISGKEQVLLKVRIVEMQRTVTKQLGVNLSSALNFTPELSAAIATDNEFSLVGRSLGGLQTDVTFNNLGGGDVSQVGTTLRALERVGLVRTLAEPNLTAISGESAEFLAGGEFPVPVGRDTEGNIIIEYKPFGVGLTFTPMVLSEGRISLFVSTEVSELTDQGALELSGSSIDSDGDGVADTEVGGLTLPGLKVRRAQTTVEMPSGGSLVMAGLIQDKVKQNIDGVPGAKDIPALGALFRARDSSAEETELVVIVTPYFVDPTAVDRFSTPGDGYATPHDLETFFLGRLTKVYGAPGASTEAAGWSGPVGYILDEEF